MKQRSAVLYRAPCLVALLCGSCTGLPPYVAKAPDVVRGAIVTGNYVKLPDTSWRLIKGESDDIAKVRALLGGATWRRVSLEELRRALDLDAGHDVFPFFVRSARRTVANGSIIVHQSDNVLVVENRWMGTGMFAGGYEEIFLVVLSSTATIDQVFFFESGGV